ncbi:serine/threonine-protein phosphatase [bacterium]|nr:serine/threonine-protein phosphatase [bacterium]
MKTDLAEVKNSLAKKLIINFLIICTVTGIILTSLSYHNSKKYIWKLFSRIATSCAISTADTLYDAPINDYLHHKKMESYDYYLNILKNFAKAFGLKYLYVYVPDIKTDKLIPVFGVMGESGKPIDNFSLGEPPENLRLNKNVVNMFLTKQRKLTLEMNNEYGHVLTGYSTIIDKNGNAVAIVGADIDFNYLMRKLLKDCSLIFTLIFSTLSILYFLGIFYIQKTFIKPILQLSTEMTKYLHQDIYNSKNPITLSTDDELNIIANLCNGMALEKKRIENELNIAKTIQSSSLPTVFPPYPDNKEFDIFANMVTAKEVGGDFYDFFFVDKDNFVFLVADVSGKGIPAALFMMEIKTLTKNIVKTGIPIDQAITKVNHKICKNNKENFFVTMFLASINLKTGNISFVNAGHNPPLLKRTGSEFEYFKINENVVLGIVDDYEYQKKEDKLNKNDLLFLYTDGVTESVNDSNTLYGEENLKNTLNIFRNFQIEEIISNLENNLSEYAQNAEQNDDITTLIFKYNGDTEINE